ncbi:MAG: hypothetical protein A07HR60_02850 [uncultured archaeon A07HR60]|nr:MAG: hypothetical protein A07HR60_02850 [uncultured archaeon A07HR60]
MLTPINLGLIAAGLLLAFVGAAVSVYAVTLTGLVIGGGGGYLVAPQIMGLVTADPVVVSAGTVVAGAVIGGFLGYTGLSLAVLGIGATVGTFLGRYTIGPFYGEGLTVMVGATLAGLALGALVGFVLTRTTLVLSTAFIGGALASRNWTVEAFRTAGETLTVEPILFELTDPLFLGVFALGALSQLGLFRFGYVTKLIGLLPGARRWSGDDDEAQSG